MTNSEWVPPILLYHTIVCISSHDQQTVSDTAFFSIMQSYTSPHGQQPVSGMALFLAWSHPMMNRMWVTLPCYLLPHHMTNRWKVHYLSFCRLLLTFGTCYPMTNRHRGWVILPFSSAMQSHHKSFHLQQPVSNTNIFSSLISSYDKQLVSDTAFFHPCSLITCSPMINRKCVTLTFFVLCLESHLMPWLTVSEQHFPLFYDVVPFNTSYPMTNSKWATLISTRQSHLISSHDEQDVSDTTLFLPCSLIHDQ